MTPFSGWRPLLRLAWRDALRARGRSALVLVMIALPVLAVTAATVVMATSDISRGEALDRRMGAADARVQFDGARRVEQSFDPDDANTGSGFGRGDDRGLDDIRAVLGPDVRGITWGRGTVEIVTEKGVATAEADAVDLTDPLADGVFRIESGREPAADDEVAVNADLASRGFAVGDTLELRDGSRFTVVGIGEHALYRGSPRMVGPASGLANGDYGAPWWLVDGGEVSWSEVRELNEAGGLVLSRAVLTDPPPESEIPADIRSWNGPVDSATIAVGALVVSMALLEVVLLAGPAFAVGARKRSRDLALMAASGATPAQGRRTILASGVVLGALGAGLGVVLGLGVGWAVLPLVQRYSGSWFGPYDVVWWQVGAIAAFGLVSALLAAVVPAWIASRQDVVAVLAGRRGDRRASLRSPLLGLLLLGAGVAGSVYGAVGGGTEISIAVAALVSVLGMILLVPVVLVGVARLARVFPLVLRYATRDASRHRTRTVPAVAAVAATVAGVVALGIANASDAAQNEATYQPSLAMGQGAVNAWEATEDRWDQFAAVVARELPDATVTRTRGIPESSPDGRSTMVGFRVAGDEVYLSGWGSTLGSSVLVADEVPEVLGGLGAADRQRADAVLAAGGVMLFASEPRADADVRVRVSETGPRGGRAHPVGSATVAATFVRVDGDFAPAQAVLSTAAAERIGVETTTAALVLDGGVTEAQERDLSEALAAISSDVGVYVERGYTNDDETTILLLVLGVLGGVLMLGGTLTATFLALSDARPDLATLAAVGASPRSRRGVASSYALVVGFVGALLGAAVGFVPGVAVSYPLTSNQYYGGEAGGLPSHYLDVPWLLIGTLVVALPLLTALIVGLTARSRLPLVARLG